MTSQLCKDTSLGIEIVLCVNIVCTTHQLNKNFH